MYELVVDNFAGGGGASTGIEMATGRSVDIAINHDPEAIAMHRANHPTSKHYCEDVWHVDPIEACEGRPVGLAWFSPDCKHFSKAKGGKPVSKKVRGLAWVAVRWAKKVRPRVIMLENVEEFVTWGPLDKQNKPIPEKRGDTFRRFVRQLENKGYVVEWRLLSAADYGAPTVRKRFFLIARCDGMPIAWPKPTHGDPESLEVRVGLLKPWIPVADVLDFELPCPSIFDSSDEIYQKYGIRAMRPLSEKTLRRIARGLKKFVLENPQPFLIQYHSETTEDARGQSITEPIKTIDTSNRYGLVSAFIHKYYDGSYKGAGSAVDDPVHTITAIDHNSLACAFVTQFNHYSIGQKPDAPLSTIATSGAHHGDVRAFLVKYYGTGDGSRVNDPAPTATTKDRFGLVEIQGAQYQIIDIGLRMLTPRELFDAQGFPHDYIIDVDADGKPYPKAAQVARCGNAVCPPIPAALVRANLPEMCKEAAA
jgi:DNA (cytosine-5)-methyltransferase 1